MKRAIAASIISLLLGVEMWSIAGLSAQERRDDHLKFIRRVLAGTEDAWDAIFIENGKRYEHPRVVLFSQVTSTACGTGVSQTGPFYCPLDRKIYLDTDFFRELKETYKAPGELAMVYVIAHEVGHHVQNLLGIDHQIAELEDRLRALGDEVGANRLSVRLELQADCFAGIFLNRVDRLINRLEASDIDAGLNAASQVGDDAMLKRAGDAVQTDSFTHGNSEQRARWFRKGIELGKMNDCNTFDVDDP